MDNDESRAEAIALERCILHLASGELTRQQFADGCPEHPVALSMDEHYALAVPSQMISHRAAHGVELKLHHGSIVKSRDRVDEFMNVQIHFDGGEHLIGIIGSGGI